MSAPGGTPTTAAPRTAGGASMTTQQSLPGTPTVSTPGPTPQSQSGPMSQQNLNQIVSCVVFHGSFLASFFFYFACIADFT